MDEWIDSWTNSQMDMTDGWMDWIDGWMDEQMYCELDVTDQQTITQIS